MANRLRRRTSDQTVLGSNPAVAAALSPWTRLFTPIVPRRSLHISFYSQTCELRPPKGLGISGPISQVVSFARFGSTIFYTCPCTSQRHQQSALPTCTRGRNWQRPCQAELVNVMIARSECLRRKSWMIEKYFSLNLTYVVAFHRLNRHFGPTSGVRNSHFSGGRNFKNALRTFESAN